MGLQTGKDARILGIFSDAPAHADCVTCDSSIGLNSDSRWSVDSKKCSSSACDGSTPRRENAHSVLATSCSCRQ
eukprot:355683-Chlamydomonas_euryale.AAC.4